MIHSMKKALIGNIVEILNNPPRYSAWVSSFFELVIFDFEIGLVLPNKKMLNDSFSYSSREYLKENILYSIVGWTDYKTKMASISSNTFVWVFLLLSISVLTYWNFMAYRRKRQDQPGFTRDLLPKISKTPLTYTPQLDRFAKFAIMHYRYINYFAILFGIPYLMCVKTEYFEQTDQINSLFPVYYIPKKINYSNGNEFQLTWYLNREKKCYQGEYFVIISFAFLLLLLNFSLKSISDLVVSFSPNPSIPGSRKNRFYLVHFIVFFLLVICRDMILNLRYSQHTQRYYILVIFSYCLIIGVLVVAKPYYSTSLVKLGIFKSTIVVLIGCWMIFEMRPEQESPRFSYREKSQMLPIIILCLLASLSTKILSIVSDVEYFPKSLAQIIYSFEMIKDKIGLMNSFHNYSKHQMRQILEIIDLFSKHKSECHSIDCECRIIEKKALQKRLNEALEKSPNKFMVYKALFSINHMLDKKLNQILIRTYRTSNERTTFLKVWASFSLWNFGCTTKLLSLLSLSPQEAKGSTKTSRFSSSIPLKIIGIRSLGADITRELVITSIRNFESSNHVPVWTDLIIHSSSKNIKTEKINLSIVLEFFNKLCKAKTIMVEVLKFKEEIIRGYLRSKLDSLTFSSVYHEKCKELEERFRKLEVQGYVVPYISRLMEIHYYRNIKEDFVTASKKVVQVVSKLTTNDFGHFLNYSSDFDLDHQTIVISIGGEKENFHRITHFTLNIVELGFRPDQLSGADLELILPLSLSPIHMKALSPTHFNSHLLPRRKWVDLGFRTEDGFLVPGGVTFRVNSKLCNGIEYVGMIRYDKLLNENKMSLLIDEKGVVQDVCKQSRNYFQTGQNISATSKVFSEFLSRLAEALKKVEFEGEEWAEAFSEGWFEDPILNEEILDKWVLVPTMGLENGEIGSKDTFIKLRYQCLRFSERILFMLQITTLSASNDSAFDSVLGNINTSGPLKSPKDNLIVNTTSLANLVMDSKHLASSGKVKESTTSKIRQAEMAMRFPRRLTASMLVSEGRSTPILDLRGVLKKNEQMAAVTTTENMVESNQSVDIENGRNKKKITNLCQTTVKDILKGIGKDRIVMKHSRFIHHNINFKGIKRMQCVFCIPFILIYSVLVWAIIQEADTLYKFNQFEYDVAVFDSVQYMQYSCLLEMQYFTISRMLFEGILDEDQFADFGISNLTEHVRFMTSLPIQNGILENYLLKTSRMQSASNYRDWYDRSIPNSEHVQVMDYERENGSFQFLSMKTLDAARKTEQFVVRLLDSDYIKDNIGQSYKDIEQTSPEERAAYFNMKNPILLQSNRST